MVRCSKIMKMQRDIHTTVLSSLEGIAVQVRTLIIILLLHFCLICVVADGMVQGVLV